MRNTAMFWVGLTSLLLLTVTVMTVMNLPFNWVFYVSVLGQSALVYMVYKVLTDNYKTEKTFEDFYEDVPAERYR